MKKFIVEIYYKTFWGPEFVSRTVMASSKRDAVTKVLSDLRAWYKVTPKIYSKRVKEDL